MAVDRETLFNQATAQRERWNYKVNYAQAEELRSKVNSGEIDISSLPYGGSTGYSDILSVLEQVDEMASFAESGAGADWGEPPRRSGRPPEAPVTPVQAASDTTPTLDSNLAVQASEGLAAYEEEGTGYDWDSPVIWAEDVQDRTAYVTRGQEMRDSVFKTAILKSKYFGKAPLEAGKEAVDEYNNSPTGKSVLSAEISRAIQDEQEETKQVLGENLSVTTTPEQADLELGATTDYLEFLQGLSEDDDLAFYTLTGATPEMAKRMAVDDKVVELINKIAEKQTLGSAAGFMLKEILLPMDLWRGVKIAGNPFNAKGMLEDMITSFQEMPAEEQEEILPAINSWLEEAVDDNTRAMILSQMITPPSQRDLRDFDPDWIALDLTVIPSAAVGTATALAAIARRRKAVNKLKELEAKEDVAEGLATSVVTGDTDAKEMLGVNDKSLYNSAMPFRASKLDPDAIDGAAAETQEKILSFSDLVGKWVRDKVQRTDKTMREGAFSTEELRVMEENIVKEVASREKVDNVEVIGRDDLGVTIQYEGIDETGEIVQLTERLNFSIKDKAGLEVDSVGIVGKYIWSPLAFFRNSPAVQAIARAAQRLDTTEATTHAEMQELMRMALSPITGKSGWKGLTPAARKKLADVELALMRGDKEERVFSVKELRDGTAAGGARMTDDQIEVYFNIRTALDNFHMIRQNQLARELILRGETGVLVGPEGTHIAGKVLRTPSDARNSFRDNGARMFYDPITGETRSFDGFDLEKAYDEGYYLTRMDQSRDLGDGNEVLYALVKDEDIVEEFPDLVGYKTGYVPKIHSQSGWFVKERKKRTVDGEVIPATSNLSKQRTVRAFATRAEAEEYAIKMQSRADAEGTPREDLDYIFHGDRELEKEASVSSAGGDYMLSTPGRLYSGHRSTGDSEILYGATDEGLEVPRLDAYTSISRYISNLSRHMSRNEWRMGVEESVLKTANSLRGDGDRVFETFEQLAGVEPNTPNNRIISALYNQTRDWMGFPSQDEMWFADYMQNLIDSSLASKLPKSARGALYSLKDKDLFTRMRAWAFHPMLGWLNPIQLIVQAQGAAVAASMNIFRPDRLAAGIRDQMYLRMLQKTDVTPEEVSVVWKAMGMKQERAEELFSAWKKTGYEDSVYATADHAAAAKGYGVGADAISRAADKAALFYKEGEMFNRRFSFVTAYDEWRRANPTAPLDDDALRGIMDRSNNFMLNMSKGNRNIYWQRGALSVPTQFQQINAKVIESALGLNGNFSAYERVKILMGQGALYGAAGVPMGTLGTRYAMEMLGYNDIHQLEQDISPEQAKLINEGILGLITLTMFGVDLEVGDRLSLNSGLEAMAESLMFEEETLAETFGGASGTSVGRFWEAAMRDWKPLAIRPPKNHVLNPATFVANPFLATFSSFRNVDKAVFMHKMGLLPSEAQTGGPQRDFSWKEKAAVAMGWSLKEDSHNWQLKKDNKLMDDYRNKFVVPAIMEVEMEMMRSTGPDGYMDPEIVEWGEKIKADLLATLNPGEVLKVQKSIREKRRSSTRSNYSNVYDSYREKSFDRSVDALNTIERARQGFWTGLQSELGRDPIRREGLWDNLEENE